MFSLLVLWMAEIHQETLLEEAKGSKLVVRGRANKPGLEERALVGLGAWLVSLGLRLQARYRPEMRPVPESCGPVCG